MLHSLLITAITIAMLVPAGESRTQQPSAPRFVSLDGRFSVSLPDPSDPRRVRMSTPFGDAPARQYEWKTKEAGFGVAYTDIHQLIKQPEAVNKFFDEAAEHFTQRALANGGNTRATKKLTLDERPGIEQRADLPNATIIRRLYLVSRRIYEITVVVQKSQRKYENNALSVLDSFKLLTESEITDEALKAGPALPQTPEAPRAGSDADEEGLRGPVKSVRTEIQYLVETPFTRNGTRSSITTYNEKGNRLRKESFDFKNNLDLITVYGYVDGRRVSASKSIDREYGLPVGTGGGIGGGGHVPSNRKKDTRYDHWFEYKYDEKKHLVEQAEFVSNGDFLERSVYKYEGNQKEELVYSADGTLRRRDVYILNDKGDETERTYFDSAGKILSKFSYTYEYDSKGNWTKRTNSQIEGSERLRQLNPPSIHLRTITYY